MPLIVLARIALSFLSLAVLIAGGYLLWSWYDGEQLIDAAGRVSRIREDWRLWTAVGLLAWSFLGRLVVTPLIARSDTDPTRAERGETSTLIESPTGSRLYVEAHGQADAPTVILIHGWGLDSTIWFYLRRALSSRYRVIVWDLPGLGRSKAAAGAIDLSHFARDLQAVMDFAAAPAILIGHSIGGMTIQTLIRDHPGAQARMTGIVLVNTTYTNPLRTMIVSPLALALRWPVLEPALWLAIPLQPIAWLMAWQSYISGAAHLANRLGFAGRVTRSQLEHTTLLATRNPPAALARGNLAMFRWDADGALQAMSIPALVIAGDADIVTLKAASEVLARAAAGGVLATVDQANHMGFLERSDAYGAEIEAFCDAISIRSTPPAPSIKVAWPPQSA
ncbi:alpha/beta fold hydrolase [Caulobacter segnis]